MFQDAPEIEILKGIFVHFSGISEGTEVTREDVKAALGEELEEKCAWIDFTRGQTKGYLRFKDEDYNKQVIEKTEGKIKVILRIANVNLQRLERTLETTFCQVAGG